MNELVNELFESVMSMRIGAVGGYTGIYPAYDRMNSIHNGENNGMMVSGNTESAKVEPGAEFDPDKQVKPGRRSSPEDCETCKNRKYQDGSNEANVSFKTAAHVSPEAAAGAVRAHEQQHVSNAYKKAAEGDGKVVSANVSIHTAVCPECGKSYVSGGTTRTSIMYGKNGNSAGSTESVGNNIDYQV